MCSHAGTGTPFRQQCGAISGFIFPQKPYPIGTILDTPEADGSGGMGVAVFSMVDLESFGNSVLADETPVLLAFLGTGREAQPQAEILAALSHIFSNRLRVCLVEEDSLEAFKGRYTVMGTPTYLLFHKGRECERMLGEADDECLIRFVRNVLGWREEKRPVEQ